MPGDLRIVGGKHLDEMRIIGMRLGTDLHQFTVQMYPSLLPCHPCRLSHGYSMVTTVTSFFLQLSHQPDVPALEGLPTKFCRHIIKISHQCGSASQPSWDATCCRVILPQTTGIAEVLSPLHRRHLHQSTLIFSLFQTKLNTIVKDRHFKDRTK